MFPLPDGVLFPGVGIPLHVFEARYRLMMEDVTTQAEADRWIALALLKEGYAHLYNTPKAPVHPVVCLARLVHHHRLSDGRFNVFLLGAARVTVLGENRERSYRRVRVTPLAPPSPVRELEKGVEDDLRAILSKTAARGLVEGDLIDKLNLVLPNHEQWVDTLVYHFLPAEESALKQRILEEPDLAVRAEILSRWLESSLQQQERRERQPSWPPRWSDN